jgi:aspartyl-tRNA(Asn)/glutamyl-tRNA(Gln) amidotransferase subunit B
MEEGSLRVDANVSLRPTGTEELGTKAELKNMNSFRFLERGIAAELERQAAMLDAGEQVVQETLHFDPRSGGLTALRSKEYAHDYRYFPEPDLVPLAPTTEMIDAARATLPELPAERRERYLSQLELPDKQATQLAFDAELGDYFEEVLAAGDGAAPATVANWVTGELAAAERQGTDEDAGHLPAPDLARLIRMVEAKEISHGAGRQVLAVLVAEGGDPAAIVEREGLAAFADAGELEAIVDRALESDPEAAEGVREGNMKAVGPLVGFVMRETRGAADGGEVTRIIREKLGLS